MILATASGRTRTRARRGRTGSREAVRAMLFDGADRCYSRADPVALTVALEAISQCLDVQD